MYYLDIVYPKQLICCFHFDYYIFTSPPIKWAGGPYGRVKCSICITHTHMIIRPQITLDSVVVYTKTRELAKYTEEEQINMNSCRRYLSGRF